MKSILLQEHFAPILIRFDNHKVLKNIPIPLEFWPREFPWHFGAKFELFMILCLKVSFKLQIADTFNMFLGSVEMGA